MNKLVFLVLSPFNYKYKIDKFYSAGQRITFELTKDLKELQYLIYTDNFELLHLDKYNSNSKAVEIFNNLIFEKTESLKVQSPDYFLNSSSSNERLKYLSQPYPSSNLVSLQTIERFEEAEDAMLEATPIRGQASNISAVREDIKSSEIIENEKVSNFKYTKEYLESLHWRELKRIMEKQENINYTNKEEAIEVLLNLKQKN